MVSETSTGPADLAGVLQVSVVGLPTEQDTPGVPPNVTVVAPAMKSVPASVTVVPPRVGPLLGVRLVKVGATGLYVKEVVAEPPEVVTVTVTLPELADGGVVQESCVAVEFAVQAAVLAPNLTVPIVR